MRKVLLTLCVAGLLQSAASADVLGSWARDVQWHERHLDADIDADRRRGNGGDGRVRPFRL